MQGSSSSSSGATASSTGTTTGSNSVSGFITPTPARGSASAPSTALTLEGAPPPNAAVGARYSFQPTVSPSSAGVKFAISGQPAWITFDTSTGALAGTPIAADEGTTGHIVVTASVGSSSSTSLTPFTIQVHPAVTVTPTVSAALSWIAPTENADGSPVTDLAGYRIYYGTNAADLTSKVDVSGAQSTTYVLKGLSNGRYFFAVVAFNSLGFDSGYSSLVNAAL
jgi:Putative Ig domain